MGGGTTGSGTGLGCGGEPGLVGPGIGLGRGLGLCGPGLSGGTGGLIPPASSTGVTASRIIIKHPPRVTSMIGQRCSVS